MDEYCRKLAFKSQSIQKQVIFKLYNDTLRKMQGKLIDGKQPEPGEFKLLLEHTGSDDQTVAKGCCVAIVTMVKQARADIGYVLKNLLNQVSSARSLIGLVEGICELLSLQVLQSKADGQKYTCPFKIRTPPHPLVTLMINRPEEWPAMVQALTYLCCHNNSVIQEEAIKLLSPFLKYILLDPEHHQHIQPIRSFVQRYLVHLIRTTANPILRLSALKFICECVPCAQMKTRDQLQELSLFVTDVTNTCCSLDDNELSFIKNSLQKINLGVCKHLLNHGLNIKPLTSALVAMVHNYLELMKVDDAVFIHLTSLLMKCPMAEAENLLLLSKVLMEKGGSIVAKATLVLPLLQILSASRNVLSCPRTVSVQALAEEVMFLIQNLTPTNPVKKSRGSRASLDPSEGQSYAHLTLSFSHNASAAAHWLKNLTFCIPHMATVPTTLSSIVAALLTLKMGSEVTILALQVIAAITKKDSKQAPSFLCLMLYQLKLETHPQVVKEILRTIPLLAVDKMNVAPVLRTILSFKSCAAMRPQYISMLSSLWQLQDRCFPHLLEAISDTGIQVYDKVTGVDEVKLAQAKAIREICRLRPEQHGSDMLGPISSLLEENPEERDTPIAALVLEGLYFLCEAEVVSIMSVWSVLKEKLIHDTRPLVIMRMCQLFSLVPALHVETPEYESFTAECVLSLWLFTGLDEPKVRGAALRALAAYNPTFFKLSHFPTQVVQEFEAKLHAVNKDKDQEAEMTLDELFPTFPADVYIRLMRTMPGESLPDYKVFLSAMIKNEVKNIPRGVHYNSIQKSVSTNQKKVVEGIPAFIEMQYNQLKLPAVRPGLAAGLLFTFNPSMEVGKDGRPKKHSIIGLSKKYKEMFLTLLQEVPVQPSEWHRSVLLPQAWLSFVDRLYTALIEARKAEVDLQLTKQHLDQEDAEERKLTSWLWARDAISDAIKTSSRGSPTVQSNCVYALGALTATVASHVASMDKKEVQESEESTEYRTHSYWSMVAIDTLMSIMNIKHMPKGKILGLCQQKSVEDRLPASILAQGSACVALSLAVPCLISTNVSKLHDIMHFLTSLLPGKPGTDETPLLSFHAALGLGLFLAKFLEENVANMAEEKVFEDTQQCFKELESSCFDESQDNRTGPLLGLAVTCQAICLDRQMESQTDMNCLLQRLIAMFKSVEEGNVNVQPLSVCIVCAAGAGFAANLVSMEMATDVVTLLSTFCNDHPENAGVALSLGMLIHALHQAGHPGVNQKRKDMYAGWLSTIESKAIPSVHKLAALNGVLSVTGAENSLIPVTSSDTDSEQDLNVKDVVKTMCHLVTNGNDLSLQRNCAWLLGRLYFSLISQTESRSSVPSTYGYLPEESFLRACADFLLDAGRQGAKEVSPAEVEVTLKCLADVEQALPPVNFSAILTPLMQPTFGEIVQTLSLRLAVNQCGAMPTVAFFLSRWMVPPLLSFLCSSSLELLYRSLAVLSKSVSPGALKSFLEHALKPPFVQWDGPPVEGLLATLEGLSDALKVRDPSAPVKNILQNAIEDFYKTPDIGIKQASYLCAIGECLSHLPFEILDTLISEDFFHEQRFYLGTFVRCYLVARGRQPVAMLNSCIDSFLCNSLWDEAETLCLLLHGFQQITLSETVHASTISRQKWFVELLGHTRNLLTGAVTLGEDVDKQRLSRIAVYLVGAILFLWTTPSTAALFDLQPMMFQTGGHRQEMTFGPQASLFLPFATIEDNLTEPWDQLVPKIIDWMLTVLSVEGLDEELQNQLKVNLVCLKHQQEMKKPQVWARVFDQL